MSHVNTQQQQSLEQYFEPYRQQVIGASHTFQGPYGEKPIIYADWTASGRLYGPIEDRLREKIMPYVANTHTETTATGCAMTDAYHHAIHIIKDHVGAHQDDVLISQGSGMTGVINKFQRILGFKIHERYDRRVKLSREERPVIFVTHMEHHSNQTSWLETIAEVEVIEPTKEGLVDLNELERLLEKYSDREIKIAAVTSCSNVTGIMTPYHEIAEMMHKNGGLCFVDFACSGPYIEINMHPENPAQRLDAIYFSPHKFLGGPGSTGILLFNKALYQNEVPDNPGGGTVDWTNPWGMHKYIDDIEAREDGGTPAFLQTIKVALAIKLKEEMGVEKMLQREHELIDLAFDRLTHIPGLHLLADQHKERLGVFSFYIENCHYNLVVRLLNDRFGVQTRGGCSCAGTYGHYLLEVSPSYSKIITSQINYGDLSQKPGWVRMSIHPVMSNEELIQVLDAIEQVAQNHEEWGKDYEYDPEINDFIHQAFKNPMKEMVEGWFEEI